MYVPVITNRSRAAPSSPLSKITVFISFSPLSVNISLAGVSGSTLIYSYGNLSKRGRGGGRGIEKRKRERGKRKKRRRWRGGKKSENEYLNPSEPSVGAFYCRLPAITLKFQTRVNKCTRVLRELYMRVRLAARNFRI